MRSLSRLVPVAIAGMLGACGGGDSATGPKAGSVTGIAGDNATAPTGGTLPVSFVVLGADGFPLSGAKVAWTVSPTSAAAVTPTAVTTDATGAAATTVNVGSTQGAFTVSGKVNGVDPVAFHLTAVNPCQYLNSYTFGATASGTLSRADCKLNGYFYDFYRLDLPTAQQSSVSIGMQSSKFDAYVELYTLNGDLIGADNNVDQGVKDARLDIILGAGGTYVIGANSLDQDTVGAYTLNTSLRPTSLTGCRDVWVTPGATVIDTIRTTDCLNTGFYSDEVFMWIQGGTTIRLSERATAFDPLLKLYQANFSTQMFDSVWANNDSSGTNKNAYFSFAVPTEGFFLLDIGTAVAGQTGEYTLAFSSNTSAGPTAFQTPAAPQPLHFFPFSRVKGWRRRS